MSKTEAGQTPSQAQIYREEQHQDTGMGMGDSSSSPHFDDVLGRLSPEEYAALEKKLVWKMDLRLMPILFVIIILK